MPWGSGRNYDGNDEVESGDGDDDDDDNDDDDDDDDDYDDNQSSIKCCSAAAPLRAEQGPCEPSEDVVRKFGEQ